jgi:hypothetical protein
MLHESVQWGEPEVAGPVAVEPGTRTVDARKRALRRGSLRVAEENLGDAR